MQKKQIFVNPKKIKFGSRPFFVIKPFIKLSLRNIGFIFATAGMGYFMYQNIIPMRKKLENKLDDFINSDEVKGEGIILVEGIFKDKDTIDNIITNLKEITKEKAFEDTIVDFIKKWIESVFKQPKFIDSVTKHLLDILSRPELTKEYTELGLDIAENEQVKDNLARLFKDLFTSDEVLDPLSALFRDAALKALDTEVIKEKAIDTLGQVFSDKGLKKFITYKTIDFLSVYSKDRIYLNYDDTLIKKEDELINRIKNL